MLVRPTSRLAGVCSFYKRTFHHKLYFSLKQFTNIYFLIIFYNQQKCLQQPIGRQKAIQDHKRKRQKTGYQEEN